jgi:hypothetical protein
MARRITFEVVTKAQTRELKALAGALDDIVKSAKGLNRAANLDELGENLERYTKSAKEFSTALGSMGRRLDKDLGDQSDRAAKNVETLQTRMNGLTSDIGKLNTARTRMKTIADRSRKAEEELAEAQTRVAEAQRRLRDAQRRPDTTEQDTREAAAAHTDAAKAVQRAEGAVKSLREEWRKTSQQAIDAERNIRDIEEGLEGLRKAAGGKATIQQLLGPGDAENLLKAKDAIRSFQAVMGTMGKDRDNFDRMARGVDLLGNAVKSMEPAVGIVRNMGNEIKAMTRLNVQDVRRSIGNTDAAVRQTATMFDRQAESAISLRGEMSRLQQVTQRWAAAENATNALIQNGNTARLERQRVTRMLATATSQASSIATTAAKNEQALLRQERQLQQERLALINRINAAQMDVVRQDVGSAAQREAIGHLNRLRTSYTQLDQAIDQNSANLRENAVVMRTASAQADRMDQSTRSYRTAIESMVSAAGRNPFQSMINNLREMNNFAMRMARTFSTQMRGGISTATQSMQRFVGSAGQVFSGLQRALQSTGAAFDRFAAKVENSMRRSHESMLEMYAAGYALMSIGRELQQFGMQGFRTMGMQLDRFMEYERARTVAGIAGAQPYDAQGRPMVQLSGLPVAEFRIDSGVIDDLIYGLQRGTMIPKWMEGQQGRLPVTFDATELAQGLYYFSSAIGVPITEDNMLDVGGVVTTMMQMAKVTNTGIEQATKGIMNIAMEYGYDPRLLGSEDPAERERGARELSKITAQVGYLSNISTMEVSDIVETFKMVGPMANILSGGEQGQGLEETFLMAFLASEVGLRGGNTGRGINRAFSSLLDPTPKMLEALGMPDEAAFRDLFFEPGTDQLKGGIMGFMETLATRFPEEQQASLLAELFTENATRTLVGMIGEFAEGEGLDEFLKEFKGENPFRWLEAAMAESQNTISGWFTFMSNGWFQFTRAMTQSIQGPLMGGFQLVGEFLFELAERIDQFPAIGQTIAAIVTSILSLAAVGGTVMMIAGGILLLGRSFAMLGGYVLPFIRLMAMAGATLFALVPLFAVLATVVGLAVYAVKNNVAGLGDAFNGVKNFFGDFEGNIIPFIDNLFDTMARLSDAFRIFIEGILLGGELPTTDANTLFAGIQKLFGDMLGNEIINRLMAFRENLGPLRQDIADFFSARTFNVTALRNAGDAVRGFLEAFAMGRLSIETRGALQGLGAALGIDNLANQVQRAGVALRGFASDAVTFAMQIARAWVTMSERIYQNISRTFGGNLEGVFAGMGTIIQGVMSGILLAITGVFTAIELITGKIADFSEGLREAEAAGSTFLGFAISFEGVLRAIGVAIGLYLGARLMLAFSPLASILVTIIPLVTGLGAAIIGIGGRMAVMAAQIAITTAAFAAQTAVMAFHVTAKLASAAASMTLAAAESLAAGATGALAGVATLATGSLFALAGAMAAIAAIVGVVVGVLLAFAGAVTLIAGVMIVWVGATQGIGAAMAALASFLQGAWSGLQFGINVLSTFIGWIHALAGAIGSVLGVGNAFYVMGFMVGAAISAVILAIVGLIGALAVLAGAWIVAWAASLSLPTLAVIAIAAIIAAVYMMGDEIAAVWDNIVAGASIMWANIADIALETVDQIANAVVNMVNLVIEGLNQIGNAGDFVGITRDDISKWEPVDLNKDIRAKLDAQREAAAWPDYDPTVRIEVEGKEDLDGIMGMLDKIGVTDYLIDLGLDPENMNVEDMRTALTDLFMDPEAFKFDANAIDFGLPEIQDKFVKDMQSWKDSQAVVARGEDPEEFWAGSDIVAPTTQPDVFDYYGPMAEENQANKDEAEAHFKQTQEEWIAAIQEIANMSLPDMLGALHDPMAGAGGKSLISFLAGVGDQIVQNAQAEGGAQWLNMDELLADVAGSGVDINENMAGQNIHKALEPAMRIIQDQTGIAMETLMMDIPKFYAPEQFLNVATSDMVSGIADFRAEYGDALYRELDLLGTDFILPDGTAAEEWGLNWAELNQYAVSNAVAGIDWNLADYIAESWDISVAEAEAYLAANGIDADAVSDEWYSGVAEAVRSNAGQFNVMTQEQYDWLADATQGFATQVINMTEAEFMGMSDTMKLILTNMGYTFVLTDVIPQEAMEKAQAQVQEFKDIVTGIEGLAFEPGADTFMAGEPAEWLKVGEFQDAAGNIMVTLQDLDGTRVSIPAAEWYDYRASLLAMQGFTEQAITAIRGGWAAISMGYVVEGTGMIGGGMLNNAVSQAVGKTSAGEAPTLDALGLLPEVTVKVNVDTSAAEQAVEGLLGTSETTKEYSVSVTAKVGSLELDALYALGSDAIRIPITAFVSSFEFDALYAFDSGAIRIPVTAFVSSFEFDALYAFGSGAIRIPVTAYVSGFEFDAVFAVGDSLRVPVTAYVSSFEFANLYSGDNLRVPVTAYINSFEVDNLYGEQSLRVPVTAYVSGFEFDVLYTVSLRVPVTAYVSSFEVDNLYSAEALRVPVTAEITQTGVDAVISAVGGAISAAQTFAVTWTATITQSGADGVSNSIGNAIGVARVYAVTWKATITQSGADGAREAINRAKAAADDFAGTYTATINVNDNATSVINGAINALNNFDGRSATSTMTTVQRTINETVTIGGNMATAATGGWRAGGQAVLVGEEGPELVYFPRNGYVFTAPETNMMLAEPERVNPFVSQRTEHGTGVSVQTSTTVNTYHFHGDITIESEQAARAWFEEMDRRQGHKVNLARRGMVPADDTRLW